VVVLDATLVIVDDTPSDTDPEKPSPTDSEALGMALL
jgi:hypothetical protein